MRSLALSLLSSSLALALVGSGCSGDAMTPNPDAGIAINGHPFAQLAEAAGMEYKMGDVSFPQGWVVELYNNSTDGCFQFMSDSSFGTRLQFHFPLAPNLVGTHAVSLGTTVFLVNGFAGAATPESGVLKVIAADQKSITGSYDVTFKTKERITGTFNAPTCNCPCK